MTTSNSSTWHEGPEPHREGVRSATDGAGGPSRDHIGIRGPGDLIAGLPGLLGFIPEDSLLTVLLGGESGREVIATMRLDLGPSLTDPEVLDAVAGRLEGMYCDDPFEVLVVIVDAAWADTDTAEECHGWIVGGLIERLETGPVGIVGAVVTPAVEHGRPWVEISGSERTGRVADPFASEVTAAHVLGGRSVHPSRAELEAVVAPGPPEECTALAQLIDRCESDVLAGRSADRAHALTCEFADVLIAVETLGAGGEPDRELTARVALAIDCPEVRDAALALTVIDPHAGGPCRELWLTLARRLDGGRRAEAAALLAFGAYADGEGALAQVAADRALEAAPGHRLSRRVAEALALGLHPERIRDLARHIIEAGGPLAEMLARAVGQRPSGEGAGEQTGARDAAG